MKRITMLLLSATLAGATAWPADDNQLIFTYSPGEREGLHVAWREGDVWHHAGQLCASDYGAWGSEKRMYHQRRPNRWPRKP